MSILYMIAVGLNTYGIYLNLRYNKKRFSRRVLLVLFCGLLHILIGYLVLVCYPQHLYLSTAFPLSMLYGAAFLFVFKASLERQMSKRELHTLPFFIALMIYVVMILYAPWRYHFYHEFYMGLYVMSSILFITYVLAIGLGFHSGPNYCLKTFVKAEKKSFIPLSVLVLVVGIMVIMGTRPGDVEAYLTFNLIFYILVLFPIIKLSLLKTDIQEDAVGENYERIKPSVSDITQMEDVLAEVKVPFIIPKNLELSYKLEIEKFIASKAYLDIDLNKNSFCESIDIPKAHVSPFLKQVYGKNFNGFINELRLAYAAKELSREELVYTIDDLSFICGFRSRASFYRNFIAAFGCSPHQYRTGQLETAH
ncbi:helix-turn-helix transcriptional regulator [Sphingobacterium chuzhouense]|uniref:helix-turn-helix transcriptional regulator n=1 Tax=Sphingobacterium chuzhouense TaxID=1742264 RepID=UPI0036D391DC